MKGIKTIALLFLLLGLGQYSSAQSSIDTAVSFTVKDITGTTYQLDEIIGQGKLVVIDFFTVTCGPCATYASEISQSFSHFGCNSGNVVFLGINWGDDNGQVAEFGQTYGAEYPEISGLEGNGNHVVSDYGVLSYPTVILIQPNRFISEKFIWPPTSEHLDSLIIEHGGIPLECSTSVPERNNNLAQGIIQTVTPNPVASFCTLGLNAKPGIYTIRILASSGKQVKEYRGILLSGQESTFVELDLESISAGYYLVQVLSGGCILDSKSIVVY